MKVQASPNIAFIKYWGKLPEGSDESRNLATNPSLSMTLSKARTTCQVRALPSTQTSTVHIQDAQASPNDFAKVTEHLKRVCAYLKAHLNTAFEVNSFNNFPQGTGLASSASAFASLTLAGIGALVGQDELERLMSKVPHDLSALARRGSGSACRSMRGPFMKWDGAYAVPFGTTYKLKDTVLIFSRQHKKIPSSEGHKSAQSSPDFEKRLKRLPARLSAVEEALGSHSLSKLGPLLEEEALELHHIARSGTPSITYLSTESQQLIDYLQTIKQRDFFFTLDAGPNVHLISESDILPQIQDLLAKTHLKCEIWQDEQGPGPTILGA